MTIPRQLFDIITAKSLDPENKAWLSFSEDDRNDINASYISLFWMKEWGVEDTAEANREFYTYYDVERASLIKRVYDAMFPKKAFKQ